MSLVSSPCSHPSTLHLIEDPEYRVSNLSRLVLSANIVEGCCWEQDFIAQIHGQVSAFYSQHSERLMSFP
ncbi:hypothetical protein NE237_027907 [Protea cynaroides]|uniref:Uncharacterized protein n=1 Tax=Protea cynaroides TaxID=273540 RepID=A0A9Q0GP96_9MAGN|nr:hypothetical protein NE237_027907 [Protea cynaroides]